MTIKTLLLSALAVAAVGVSAAAPVAAMAQDYGYGRGYEPRYEGREIAYRIEARRDFERRAFYRDAPPPWAFRHHHRWGEREYRPVPYGYRW